MPASNETPNSIDVVVGESKSTGVNQLTVALPASSVSLPNVNYKSLLKLMLAISIFRVSAPWVGFVELVLLARLGHQEQKAIPLILPLHGLFIFSLLAAITPARSMGAAFYHEYKQYKEKIKSAQKEMTALESKMCSVNLAEEARANLKNQLETLKQDFPGLKESALAGMSRALEQLGQVSRLAWLLSIIGGALITCALMIFSKPLLLAMTEDKQLVNLALEYISVLKWDAIPQAFFRVDMNFFSAAEQKRIISALSLISFFVRLWLSVGFVEGVFGLPKYGFTGVAYSQIFEGVILVVLVRAYMIYQVTFGDKRKYLPALMFYKLRGLRQHLAEFWSRGWTYSVHLATELLLSVYLTGVAGNMKSLRLEQVFSAYSSFAFLPFLLTISGVASMRANARHRFFIKNKSKISPLEAIKPLKQSIKKTTLISQGAVISISIALLLFPRFWVSLFNEPETGVNYQGLFTLFSIELFFAFFRHLRIGQLRGMKAYKMALCLNVPCLALTALVGAAFSRQGYWALILTRAIGNVVSGVVADVYMYDLMKRKLGQPSIFSRPLSKLVQVAGVADQHRIPNAFSSEV